MTNLFQKAKKLSKQLLGRLPTRIPTGLAEFYSWADSIVDTYDLPTSDTDTIRFVLATLVMHLGPTVYRRSKFYFYAAISAGASKQVASNVFREIKLAQEAAAKAASTPTIEATTSTQPAVTLDGSQQ